MRITTNKSILIGVISDTHNFLRPSIGYLFKDCGTIIHAGDIGSIKILHKLEDVTRLVAVRGNTDDDPCLNDLPESKTINLYGISFYIIHDLNKINVDPVSEGIKVVVSGHTHKPMVFEQDGVKYMNPGSAGYYRAGCPVTLGFISLENKTVNMRIVEFNS